VLRYNVAGLLKAAPGEIRTYPVTGELIEIADDLSLAAPIEGELRLSKTSRSVLVHADLSTQWCSAAAGAWSR
jgi:hypothetical protein